MANLKGFEGFGGPIHFNEDGDAVKNFFIVQGQNGAWSTKVTRLLAPRAAADPALTRIRAGRKRRPAQQGIRDAPPATRERADARRGLYAGRAVLLAGDGHSRRSQSRDRRAVHARRLYRLCASSPRQLPLPVALARRHGWARARSPSSSRRSRYEPLARCAAGDADAVDARLLHHPAECRRPMSGAPIRCNCRRSCSTTRFTRRRR